MEGRRSKPHTGRRINLRRRRGGMLVSSNHLAIRGTQRSSQGSARAVRSASSNAACPLLSQPGREVVRGRDRYRVCVGRRPSNVRYR